MKRRMKKLGKFRTPFLLELVFLWHSSSILLVASFSFLKKQKPKQFVTPFFMGRQCQAHRQLAILQTGGEKLVEYLEMYLCIWGILCPLPNTSIIQMPTDFDRPPPPRCGISIGFLVVLFLLIFVFNSIFSFISFFFIFSFLCGFICISLEHCIEAGSCWFLLLFSIFSD